MAKAELEQKIKEERDLEQIVNRIIECENQEYDEFMDYQERRIAELKELQKRKNNGESVDISGILLSLRKSGILDSNNNIMQPYSFVMGNTGR